MWDSAALLHCPCCPLLSLSLSLSLGLRARAGFWCSCFFLGLMIEINPEVPSRLVDLNFAYKEFTEILYEWAQYKEESMAVQVTHVRRADLPEHVRPKHHARSSRAGGGGAKRKREAGSANGRASAPATDARARKRVVAPEVRMRIGQAGC
jgi:poly(A) polymerase Pap1